MNWHGMIYDTEPAEREELFDLIIERRNIREEPGPSEGSTVWRCEERRVTQGDLDLLAAIEAISTEKAIDEYTEQLIEEGLL